MAGLADSIMKSVSALKGIQKGLDAAYQDTLLDIGISLVFFTPLDTGAASSNWNVGQTASYSEPRVPTGGNKGDASISAITNQVKIIKAGSNSVFFNNVDYIDELEAGKSQQARAGMLAPTKARINGFWINNLKKYGFK